MKLSYYLYFTLLTAFLLGNHSGFIALWKDPHSQPIAVFPYRVESLPTTDQVKLNQGIPVDTEQELQSLLEDFLS